MRTSSLISASLAAPLLLLCFLTMVVDAGDQRNLTPWLVVLSTLYVVAWVVPLARSSNSTIDWFHPAVLFTSFYLIYFILSGVWVWCYHDYQSPFFESGNQPETTVNRAFCLGFLSVAAFGLGVRSSSLFSRSWIGVWPLGAGQARPAVPFDRRLVMRVIALYAVIGIIFKIYHLAQFGTPSTDILLYLSPSASLDLGLNISLFVITMESMLDWAVLLAVLLLVVHYQQTGRPQGWWWVLAAVLIVSTLDYVVSGKRSSVIFFVILPVVWYNYLVRRLTARSAAMVGGFLVVAIVGLLFGRVVLPLITMGLTPTDYVGVNFLDALAFYIDSGELSTFDMVAATLERRDELLLQAGGTLEGFLRFTFSSLVIFVPRVLWPEKPEYLDLSHIYRQVLVGPEEGMGIAPTVWGAAYLFFGLAGFVAFMFVMGWLLKAIYDRLRPSEGRIVNVVVYSVAYWLIFQAMRFGTLGFVTLIVVQSMLVGLMAIWLISRGSILGLFRLPAARGSLAVGPEG